MLTRNDLSIDQLVDDLTPVRPLRSGEGLALAVLAMLAAAVAVTLVLGTQQGLISGRIEGVFLVRTGLLLLLGFAASYAAVASVKPSADGQSARIGLFWKASLALAAVFPLAALVRLASALPSDAAGMNRLFVPEVGAQCLTFSTASALLVGGALVLWMRRGAPTSPERAGLLVGLAAGGFGAAAYSLHCPITSLVYIGSWFTLAVGFCALAGRLIVPRLLRW